MLVGRRSGAPLGASRERRAPSMERLHKRADGAAANERGMVRSAVEFNDWRGRRSQFETRADSVRDERVAEAGGHGVLRAPSGAVSRDDHGRRERFEIVE